MKPTVRLQHALLAVAITGLPPAVLSADLAPDAGLTDAASGMPGTPFDPFDFVSGNDALGRELADTAMSGIRVNLDALNVQLEDITHKIDIHFDDYYFPAFISNQLTTASSANNAIETLPDGSALSHYGGIQVHLVPAPADPAGFVAGVEEYGEVTFSGNGQGEIVSESFVFSFTFAFEKLAGGSGNATLVEPQGDPATPDYFYRALYEDGTSQKILPFLRAPEIFDSFDAFATGYSINRETGLLTVPGMGTYKPGYFVERLTLEDWAYLRDNRDDAGVAYRPADLNDDALPDFEILTESGIQALYGAGA